MNARIRFIARATAAILLVSTFASVLGFGLASEAEAQLTIEHEPLRRWHSNSNVYQVRAKITSSGTVNVRRVWYSTNGGSYRLQSMQPTGRPDEYMAEIPAQFFRTHVRYYIYAFDTNGDTVTDPPMAPGQGETAHSFWVGHYETVFEDDFESGDLGWTTGLVMEMGEDDWELGPPNLGGLGPNDPLTAYSGDNVRGNDLNGASIRDGKYPANTHSYLDSPVVDCTAYNSVYLRFRRWLTFEEGIYDNARILVNGTEVWVNQDNGHVLDEEWKMIDIDISSIARGNPSVQVRFEIVTDGGLEFGGWNIDDFSIVGYIPAYVRQEVSSNSPSIGDPFTVDIYADPSTNYYFFGGKRQGNGTFDVPGGPTVFTGLEGRSQRNYVSRSTDASGYGTFTRNVPNRPALVGVVRWTSVVGYATGWIESNLHQINIMP